MTLRIEPLDAPFGAAVTGVRVTELDEAQIAAVRAAWVEHALLVFPEQHLTREEQIAFARRFGPLEFDMVAITNIRPDGTVYEPEADREYLDALSASNHWHTDSSYKPVHARGAVFCAEVIPAGGTQTEFADMRAAYDALEPSMRQRLEGVRVHHSFYERQARAVRAVSAETDAQILALHGKLAEQNRASAVRPIIKTHPEGGRRSLLIGYHACRILGVSEEESDELLAELTEFACRPSRTLLYDWSAGDAVLWDNLSLLHRAIPWDIRLPRRFWHSRIAGDPVTEAALA
jgi:alpha-ketoglutarate-dependent taurine dioxygenase